LFLALFLAENNSLLRLVFFGSAQESTGWLIDGAFRYTLQFEEERLDDYERRKVRA
jgi:hypothetical protein